MSDENYYTMLRRQENARRAAAENTVAKPVEPISCGRDLGDEHQNNNPLGQPRKPNMAFVVSIGGRSTDFYNIPSRNRPYGVPSSSEDNSESKPPKPKL